MMKSSRAKPNKNCSAATAQIKSVTVPPQCVKLNSSYHTSHCLHEWTPAFIVLITIWKHQIHGHWQTPLPLNSWGKKPPVFGFPQHLSGNARIRLPSSLQLLNKQAIPSPQLYDKGESRGWLFILTPPLLWFKYLAGLLRSGLHLSCFQAVSWLLSEACLSYTDSFREQSTYNLSLSFFGTPIP